MSVATEGSDFYNKFLWRGVAKFWGRDNFSLSPGVMDEGEASGTRSLKNCQTKMLKFLWPDIVFACLENLLELIIAYVRTELNGNANPPRALSHPSIIRLIPQTTDNRECSIGQPLGEELEEIDELQEVLVVRKPTDRDKTIAPVVVVALVVRWAVARQIKLSIVASKPCGQCGQRIPDIGSFCPMCGNRLA